MSVAGADYSTEVLFCLLVIGRHVEIHKRTGSSLQTLADLPGTDVIKSNRHLTVMVQITKRNTN